MTAPSRLQDSRIALSKVAEVANSTIQKILSSTDTSPEEHATLEQTSRIVADFVNTLLEATVTQLGAEERRSKSDVNTLRGQIEVIIASKEKISQIARKELQVVLEVAQFVESMRNHPVTNHPKANLRPKHPHFIGRKELVRLVKQSLSAKECTPIVLFGPSGIGKTELAIACVNEDLSSYSAVWVIHANASTDIEISFRNLAQTLEIDLFEGEEISAIIKKVYEKLESTVKPWLLIYDNLNTNIPFPQKGGKILVTTQYPNLVPNGKRMEVGLLDSAEAITLLEKITREQGLDKLAISAGGHPLVISQLASYIRYTSDLKIEDVLKWIDTIQFTTMEPDKKLRVILEKSLPLLPEKDLEWLQLCSFLNPNRIEHKYLTHWLKPENEHLQSTIIARLVNRGFLLIDSSSSSFSMHEMIQDYLQKNAASAVKAYVFLLGVANYSNIEYHASWEKPYSEYFAWRDHYFRIIGYLNLMMDKSPSLQATLSPRMKESFYINCYAWTKDSEDAKTLLTKIENARQQLDPKLDNVTIGDCWYLLGCVQAKNAKYSEALLNFDKALYCFQRNTSKENLSLRIAQCYIQIGGGLILQEKHSEARAKFNEAIKQTTLKTIIGECNYYLSLICSHEKNILDAKRHLDRALECWESTLCPHHPKIGTVYNDLAKLSLKKKDFLEALEYYTKACEIFEVNINFPDESLISSMIGKGDALCGSRRYAEAENMYHKALATIEKNFPNSSQKYDVLESISDVLYDQDKFQDSLTWRQKGSNASPQDEFTSSRLYTTYLNSGNCYGKLGELAKAKTEYEKAYRLSKSENGEHHPDTLLCVEMMKKCEQSSTCVVM